MDFERPLRRATICGLIAATALALSLGTAPAAAAPLKCQRTIVGRFAKFVHGRVKLLAKCHEQVVIGKRPGPCPDLSTAAKIAALDAKLKRAIDQQCGGDDRTCGTADDDTLASIGWDVGSCPGFEGGCTAPIADCGDVATCL